MFVLSTKSRHRQDSGRKSFGSEYGAVYGVLLLLVNLPVTVLRFALDARRALDRATHVAPLVRL